MEIVWYGLNCFRLTERGMATVVTDPYGPEVGLTLPRPKADIVTVSRDIPECNHTARCGGRSGCWIPPASTKSAASSSPRFPPTPTRRRAR
jgi:hypothetical protein